MSAVVKSRTAFLEKSLLLQALDELGVQYWEDTNNQIVTHRIDYYGHQKFGLDNGRYVFYHDSSSNSPRYGWRKENWGRWPTTNAFLDELERTYNRLYNQRQEALERQRQEELRRLQEEEEARQREEKLRQIEEELRRIEEQRRQYVESRKQQIIQKAAEQGYEVKEKRVNNQIQLVLVRHTYR